jgi:hypothetical protein
MVIIIYSYNTLEILVSIQRHLHINSGFILENLRSLNGNSVKKFNKLIG